MSEPLRGVNLGGWLVLEKWITPSLFVGTDAEDEYSFMQTLGAAAKLTKHRDSFITEKDFAWLTEHDIDAVRIPVGYWLLSGDDPYTDGIGYLDRAFTWAEKYNIKVLLDIHALPGSQNGNDHSGRIGEARWQKDAVARERSLSIVRDFAERYATHPALWGIEVINEPNAGIFQLALRTYYRRVYKILDAILPPTVSIIYADAWSPRIFAFALLWRRRAIMDVHLYHMATPGSRSHDLEWYYRRMQRKIRTLLFLSRLHPMIIGEWSGVVSGETIGQLPADERERLERQHLSFQQKEFARFTGTFYWSYKVEGTGTNFWDYQSLHNQ